MTAPHVELKATFWCDWWPPGEGDDDPVQWGGWCDPQNPWGTADDDPPGDPICALCERRLYYRHEYHRGCKVTGATGWLDEFYLWDDDPEPDECEHRPVWADKDGDGEPIVLTLPIYQAAEFIRDFPGGVWDLGTESDHDQDYRTGVCTAVTLHVDGPGKDAALALADEMMKAGAHR